MAFSSVFDGFAVIHAAFLLPERRKHFEAELKRVGIRDFTVIETHQIRDDDNRLKNYKGPAYGPLSLTDGFLMAIDHAESAGWNTAVIMEDDILFRKNFVRLWADVEREVQNTDWGVLALYRFPQNGSFLVSEPVWSRTRLVPIVHNTGTFCLIVRKKYYSCFRNAMLTCIDKGYPCDFFYGIFSYYNPCRIYATNRNLAGQPGGLPSSLTKGAVRRDSFYFNFRSGSPVECMIINPLHAMLRKLKH